jgi:hypothetical protein
VAQPHNRSACSSGTTTLVEASLQAAPVPAAGAKKVATAPSEAACPAARAGHSSNRAPAVCSSSSKDSTTPGGQATAAAAAAAQASASAKPRPLPSPAAAAPACEEPTAAAFVPLGGAGAAMLAAPGTDAAGLKTPVHIMLGSTMPDAAPAAAQGTQPWDVDWSSLAAAATPAFPATGLRGRSCRPGMTPGVTPGGLSGHFTALVTPGGPSWPEGMPAGGLVPYSITPPAGGRTVARTAPHTAGGTAARTAAQAAGGTGPHAVACSADGTAAHTPARKAAEAPPCAGAGTAARTPGGAGRAHNGDVAFCAGTPAAEAAAAQPPHVQQSVPAELPTAFEDAAGALGLSPPCRSVTPPAATPSSGRLCQGFELAGSAEPCWGVTATEQGTGSGHHVEPGSARRSRTPSRTPQSAVKNEALAAQLQVCLCVLQKQSTISGCVLLCYPCVQQTTLRGL